MNQTGVTSPEPLAGLVDVGGRLAIEGKPALTTLALDLETALGNIVTAWRT